MNSKSKHDNTGCTIPLNKCGLSPLLKKSHLRSNSERILFWHVEQSSRKGMEFGVGKTSRCYLGISVDRDEI